MDKFDRIQQLHRIFLSRKTPVSITELADRFECSEKTVKRNIDTLRDIVQAPLEYCTKSHGWGYTAQPNGQMTMPTLWLTTAEIQGLAIMLQVTQSMADGLLGEEISAVDAAIEQLLISRHVKPALFRHKVRYLSGTRRAVNSIPFRAVTQALLNGKQLALSYKDYAGHGSQRQVSPLKLVLYQENWYLDAWCHLRDELRSFMLARISQAETQTDDAITVTDAQQQAHFASSYGIFAGAATHQARLKFTGTGAREAASYEWHPEQAGHWEGALYLLNIPYHDDRELVRTLMGFGDLVTVLAPDELRARLLAKAKALVAIYEGR